MTDILRCEWGYTGLVMTGVPNMTPNPHRTHKLT